MLFYDDAIRDELRKIKHLDILRQCATNYHLFNFDIRQRALDLLYSIVSVPIQDDTTFCDILQPFISDIPIENYLDMYDWSLSNWEQTDKDTGSILIPIILQEFDPTKSDITVEKYQEKHRRQNQIRIAKRNREDTIIVWIYDIRTIDNNNLNTIRSHLASIRYNVLYFDLSENVSAALDFILTHQSEYMAILVDALSLHLVIDQLLSTAHISSFVYVYNSSADIPCVSFSSSNIQSCITSLAIDIELKTTQTAEFLFYESKQTSSAFDLIASLAHFIWHLLLIDALTNMPVGNHEELVTAVRHWYSTNSLALCEIDSFETTYTNDAPEICYNTNKSTLIQRILQNAFRHADMETIYFARSVIIDMSRKFASVSPSSVEVRHVFTCGTMSRNRMKFLCDHQNTLIMPVGFLIGHLNREKILNDLRRLCSKNLEKVLFEIAINNDVPVLDLGTDGVLFNIGVLFHLVQILHDSTSQIYHIRLRTISNANVTQQLIDNIIQLRDQVGETADRTLLFSSLLAQMNCVRSAMNYLLFYNNHDPDSKEVEIHMLAELGRIALRCNQLIDAEKFFLHACDLHKRSGTIIKDSVIGRIRIDLVLILARQGRNSEANALCQETLPFLCDSLQPLSLVLLNAAQGRVCLCGVTDELAYTTFENLRQDYEQKHYYCQHPSLIGGNAIDIGDMYRKKDSLSPAYNCYFFAYLISEHNLPTRHPLMLASLHRLSQLLDQKPALTEMERKLTDIWQEISSDDGNSHENKILLDTIRNLGLFHAKKDEYSEAITWFEMCLSSYRRQWPLDDKHIHQCQAYILKYRLGLPSLKTSIEIRGRENCLELNDIVLSMEYEHFTANHLLQRTADEENRRWGTFLNL